MAKIHIYVIFGVSILVCDVIFFVTIGNGVHVLSMGLDSSS